MTTQALLALVAALNATNAGSGHRTLIAHALNDPLPAPTATASPTPLNDAAGAASYVDSKGRVLFVYDDAHPDIVRCAPGRVCAIRLEDGEQLAPAHGIALPAMNPATAWSVENSEEESAPTIFVAPKPGSPTVNMLVQTDQHTYSILLESVPHVDRWRYGYLYPDDHGVTVLPTPRPVVLVTPNAPLPKTPLLSVTRYRIAGAAPYRPLRVEGIAGIVRIDIPLNAIVPSVGVMENDQLVDLAPSVEIHAAYRTLVVFGDFTTIVLYDANPAHRITLSREGL